MGRSGPGSVWAAPARVLYGPPGPGS